MASIGNIKVEPMTVTFGTDDAQIVTITTRADASSDLNNDYFFLYSPTLKYHVWYNVAAGGVDPAPAGSTAIEVAVAANASASAVASATQSAIDALAAFVATVSANVVTVTNAVTGYASGPYEGVGTGFSFGISTQGSTATDVGYTDGEIEWSVAESYAEVTAHQTGTTVNSLIRTGTETMEVVVNLKETTLAQLKTMFVAAGNSFTPVGAGASEVIGWGSGKQFQQVLAQSKALVLHPVVLPTTDRSRNVKFHKAYPVLESLTFSGEDILTVPVTFRCFPDYSLNNTVEFFAIGDHSQTLT